MAGRHAARSSRGLDDERDRRRNQTGPVRLWPGSPTLAPSVVNATELGRCTVLSSIAMPTAAITATSKAAIKLFMALPPDSTFTVRLFSRYCARRASHRRVALGLFFLDP